jgi:hypothetical protein
MKKIIITLLISVFATVAVLNAKKPDLSSKSYSWSVIEPLGLRQNEPMDTSFYNYAQKAVPSAISSAYACTGNLGAEGKNMIYLESEPMSDFFFRDALRPWIVSTSTMRFYNTRIPMTKLSYNTGGGRDNAQDRLSTVFSGNINKKAQVGALFDYLYSKGSYNYQADKELTWGLSGSYIGDRYEMQAFYNHYNLLNKENGGITDDLYIIDPAELQGGQTSINTKNIPTRLTSAHSRIVGEQLYLNNRYKVGYWHTDSIVNDTVEYRHYVPVSSFIWTLNYMSGKHLFIDKSSSSDFFENTYLNASNTYDRTSYWSMSNTIGVSLLEGFNKYAKAGLAAYATHQIRRYNQIPDSLWNNITTEIDPLPIDVTQLKGSETQNLLWVGAQLTKQQGSILTYTVTGQLGILGPVSTDVKIEGQVSSKFKLLGDTVTITGYGKFTNEEAPYYTKNYISNHFAWINDFGKIRRTRFGGILNIPHTGTNINVGVENVQNHIYFNEECLPMQHGSNVQVFSAQLNQALRAGVLNWENRITYQTSTDDNIIPLPKLAIYSNLYLDFKIAHALSVQFGVDCDYYTKYYGVGYQPATMSFYNQRETKVGNYPYMNLYANFKLSKTRFYVMMTHFNRGLFGGNNYFSIPHYPLNPSRLLMGLSIDFQN